jgi:hypothetical protein
MATTMKLIAKNVLGSNTATVTFSDIPGTFTDLLIVVSARSTRSSTVGNSNFYFNGSAANLTVRYLLSYETNFQNGTFLTDSALSHYTPGANATASTFSNTEIYIPNYAGSTNKSVSITNSWSGNSSSDYNYTNMIAAGLWSSSSAITSVSFSNRALDSANYATGSSFFLYGITKA